ncbi:cytochrome P450 [Cladorrhinum sp. PSN259]|nr:cytochrome P450 [Cladorrhinum sp. PSN259]
MEIVTVSWSTPTVGLGLVFLYFTINVIYNLFLHPLARVPGPQLWAATRLRFIRSLVTGDLNRDVQKLHEKYGEVVRTAPDEVSFSSEEALHDMFNGRTGAKQFPRDTIFWKAPPGQPENLVHTNDHAASVRMRSVAMPAFTERAVVTQEPKIQAYVDLLIRKLLEHTKEEPSGAVINIVEWMNWFAFDLIGELSLGVSFGCLVDTQNHPWVDMVFDYVKVMTFSIGTRYYPWVERLLLLLIPPSLKKQQVDHFRFTVDKLHQRVADKSDKAGQIDFVGPMIDEKTNPGYTKMSMAEIESSISNVILAGSETTGSTLSGLLNIMVQNPREIHKLENEIRGAFEKEDEMTLKSLANLPFLNSVLNEGMRLANPVPGGLLRVVPKGGATVCGYYLPEKTHVQVDFLSMAFSEKYFHRAREFLPDRWLPEDVRPTEFKNDHLNCQKPFGIGSRACIGKPFAMAEMRLLLARLVWKFDISMKPGKQVNWNELKTFFVVERVPTYIVVKPRTQ